MALSGPSSGPPSLVGAALLGSSDAAFWDEVHALHDNDALLPPDNIRASLTRIAASVATISTLYAFLVLLIRTAVARRRRKNSYEKRNEDNENISNSSRCSRRGSTGDSPAPPLPHISEYKMAYQVTNLVINLVLGLLGLYHFLYTVTPSDRTSPSQRVEGWDDLSIFGELQIGYQLWSIPVGIWLVNEHSAMLAHHVCVMIVASMSAFFTNGFRYFTPFFYGLIESSSVPLAVMNAFRGNPQLAQRYPKVSQMSRNVFIISFFTVRFVLWMPQIIDYLRIAAMLFFTCRTTTCQVGCAMSWISAVGLTFLQLLWATKIVRGLVRLASGGGSVGGDKRGKKEKAV
mmetsp:Transcript_12529/g.27071  ORF Transcript_12529/g.27071 Transcript_12529/m.27071 type:complete len:345 (+) Transcript_12529:193-1227(+)